MDKVNPSIINNLRRQELLKDSERNLMPAVPEQKTPQRTEELGERATKASGLMRILRNRKGETGAEQ